MVKTGKIYFIDDDLIYTGLRQPKKGEVHVIEKIENVIVDMNMIKFYIPTYDIGDGLTLSYNINMTKNDTGTKYAGKYTLATDAEYIGDVFCDLFENEKKYFLYGTWMEDEGIFTWWAIIEK